MSQSPEQQNTGVLGRIGSWFSPWRGRSPWNPTGDESPNIEEAPRPEGEKGALRGSREKEQQKEVEEEECQDSQANKPRLSKDLFSCVEEDARPSAHRARPLSVWGTGSEPGGGLVEEEHAEQPQKEEGKKQASESWNSAIDRNASQLTYFSSSAEEGVVGDSDQEQTQAHTQTQVQTSRKLNAYLEETSVSQSSEDSRQEVIHTHKKSVQVVSRANRIDTCENTDTEASEHKTTQLNPAIGDQGHYKALVGVTLKSPIETQPSLELSGRETNKDTMGRKNSGRRRSRKNFQGDVRSQENLQSKTLPTILGSFSSDRNSGTSSCSVDAETHLEEQEVDSSPTKNKAALTSPEGASNRSIINTVGVENNLPNTDFRVLATLVSMTDAMEEMGDNLYSVERLTETPESKRRSMKVSHSEKLFAKKVLVNSELSREVNNHLEQDFSRGITEDTTKGKMKPEINERPRDISKMDEDPRANSAASRLIVDRINLFEGKMHEDVIKTCPRSADVSPIRKVTENFKAHIKHDQEGAHVRVRSVERGNTRSRSAPPIKGKGKTVRERAMNFAEACKMEDNTVLTQKFAMAGMSQRSTPSPTSVSQSLRQDLICKTETSRNTGITSKPAEQETISVVDTPVSQLQTDSKTKVEILPKTENVADRPSQVDPQMLQGELVQPTPEVGPQTKTSGRSVSRSKRRKNKDPISPVIKDISCAMEKEVTTVSSLQLKHSEDESDIKKQMLSKEAINKSSDVSDSRILVEENKELAMSIRNWPYSGNRQDSLLTDSVNAQGKMVLEAIAEASKFEVTTPIPAVQVPVNTVPLLPFDTEPVHAITIQQDNKTTIKQGWDPVAEQNKNEEESVKTVKSPEPAVDSKNGSPVTKGPVKTIIQGEKVTPVDLSVLRTGKSSDDDTLKQGQTTVTSVEGESDKSPTPPSVDSNERSWVNKAPVNTNNPQERQNPVPPTQEALVGLGTRSSEELDMVDRTKNILVKTVDLDDKNSENLKVGTHASGQLPTEEVDRENRLLNDRTTDGRMDIVQISSFISTNTTTSTTTRSKRPFINKPEVMAKDPSQIGNGGMPQHLSNRGATDKIPHKAIKLPPLTKPTKQRPSQDQHPSLNKLLLPCGSFGDEFSQKRDTPSSWLDIDQRFPAQKLRSPEFKPKLSNSVSDLTSGELDDDFIQNIKMFGVPFSLPLRKHSHLRPPQPPFAMPAIREDSLEKSFDLENFQFGLRKKREFNLESTSSFLTKIQSVETNGEQKPARASIADRSMLCRSMQTTSKHFPDREIIAEERNIREQGDETKEKTVKAKTRPSRLEGSCIFNSLKSARTKGDGDVSPSNLSPVSTITQPTQPFPTSSIVNHVVLADHFPPQENSVSAQAVVSDSGPPLVSFNDIKLPEYLDKYLPKKPTRLELGKEKQTLDSETAGASALLDANRAETSTKSEVLKSTDGSLPTPIVPLPTPSQMVAIQGLHRRPGKMVLYEHAQFKGQAYEIFRNMTDATSLKLSPLISVKVVRGCWVLYEKPNFTGCCIALEEGAMDLTNVWAEPGLSELHPPVEPLMVIGSIRLAVSDYSIPRIDLFTEPEGHGRVVSYHDDVLEISTFGIPQKTESIKVHSGVWLVFSDPEYQGMLAVLEQGEYPCQDSWGFSSAFVGSLRPLKMGGFKVENPNEQKALVYEQPGFQGAWVEIERDVFSFEDTTNLPNLKLKSVGSLKILGGLWVGYEQPGFEGHQHVLEEGEYLDCRDWGGASRHLLSIRPILADFMSPHLEMFSKKDFDELGANIDLQGPITNLEETGYGLTTQSVHVFSGVWVAFEELGFSGEQYVLEKGLYGSPEDWAAIHPKISSVMPVMLDHLGKFVKFKVLLFSKPDFQGSVHILEDSVQSFPQGFSLGSCRVLAGSWLAFEGEAFTERMYVLEEGDYLDLRSMGCSRASASILSLQITGFEFSVPSITLFERSGLRGRRVVMTSGCVNLQMTGDCSRVQSLRVDGGMWVVYESINYRGAQILLKTGEVADWHKFSSWQRIGSLRPLIQKQVHFRIRNKQTGLVMAAKGELDDLKLMRIQTMEETGTVEEIWLYHDGQLRSKLFEDCCLSPTSSMAMAGSRLGLFPPNPEKPPTLWSIKADGLIFHATNPNLLLEVKGGQNFDKNHVILNIFDPSKLTQRWTVEIL